MRVLVAVASRHGATRGIAEEIGRALVGAGLEADVVDVARDPAPAGYDAVVLGSAIYAGRWLGSARRYVDAHADELACAHVFLFSSGPIGSPPRPDPDEAVEVEAIVERTGALDHRVFAGRLERRDLGLAERAVVGALRVPNGDFRDWSDIAEWAHELAEAVIERRRHVLSRA